MILSYPDQNDPDVQSKLSNLFELYQYSRALKEAEEEPDYVTRLQPFEHQEILKILSKTWKRFLVVNATGTGKACLMIRAAEDLLRVSNGNYPKRIIVLFQGPLTVSDYKHQIAWVCTEGKYARQEMSKRQIASNIAEKYQVTTYRKFFDEINSPDAHDNFENCMFIFEEIHNLRNLVKNDPDANNAIYSRLHSFIHKVKSPIVACVTASPMINDTGEIAPIMNLLLPMDRQLPTDWNYNLVTKEQLEPFMRGMITYVPEIRTVKEVELGEKVTATLKIEIPIKGEPIVAGNKQLRPETEIVDFETTATLFSVDLKGLQKEVYLREKARLGDNFTKNFMAVPIPISLMVFPDGSYSSDKTKVSKYISNPQSDVYIPKQEFLSDLRKNLWQYSAKYNHIVEAELNAPTTVTVGNTTIKLPGPSLSFIISPRVNGPGAVALAMCLEAFGFERYDSNSSPFVDPTAKLCGYPGRQMKITKKKRYILLAGDVSNKIDNLRSLFNSPENMFGEYIQVIIASEVAKEGINIYNTLRAYSVTQSWHHAGEYQFFSRVLRATSQTELFNEIVKKLVFAGAKTEDIEKFKLEVTIKKLVSRIDSESIEANSYMKYVEEKRFNINRVFQIMKELAYDRYLVGISADRKLEPDQLEYKNFILGEQFDEAKQLIYHKLGKIYQVFENGFTFDQAMEYLAQVKLTRYLLKKEFVATSLMWIIKSEKIFLNSSGMEVYTKLDINGELKYIPVRLWIKDIYIDPGITWYNRNLSFNKLSIEDSIDNILWSERETRMTSARYDLIKAIEFMYYDLEDYTDEFQDELYATKLRWFEKLSQDYQSFLIRWCLDKDGYFWEEKENIGDDLITEKEFTRLIIGIIIGRYVYHMKEPITNINLISEALGKPSLSRGRKSLDDSEVKIKQVKLIKEEEKDPRAERLFVDISRQKGNVLKKDDDIRVLSIKTKTWRKLDAYEIYAYKNVIEMRHARVYSEKFTRAKTLTGGIWGIKKLNGKFLILDVPWSPESDDEDSRFASKGVNCDSKSKKELMDIYHKLGGESDPKREEKNKLCDLIETRMRKIDVLAET